MATRNAAMQTVNGATRNRVAVQTAHGARQLVADLCDRHVLAAARQSAVLSSVEGAIVAVVTAVQRIHGDPSVCVACTERIRID